MINNYAFQVKGPNFEAGDKVRFKPAEEIHKEFPGASWFTESETYLSLKNITLTVTTITQVGNMMYAILTDKTDHLLNERVFELVEAHKDVALEEIMDLMK